MVTRNYTDLTIKRLYGLAGNQCSFDDGNVNCQNELISANKTNLSQICHIEGGEPDSPRPNLALTPKQLNDYENLIVMCSMHNKFIDDNQDDFSVSTLKEIKKMHEEKMKNNKYAIPDDVVQKIILEFNNTQINVQTGNGVQINAQGENVTQNFGLTVSDTRDLFEILFKENLPKLREEARKTAYENSEKFCNVFFEKATKKLSPDDFQKFKDPDVQYVLSKAIVENARRDNSTLRDFLSDLIIQRIESDEEQFQIILDEAILIVHKLTKNQLKIITLLFLLKYARLPMMTSEEGLKLFLATDVKSLLDVQLNKTNFQHIQYSGAGFSDFSIGLTKVLSRKYPLLFIKDFTPYDVKSIPLLEPEIGKLFDFDAKRGCYRSRIPSRLALKDYLQSSNFTTSQKDNLCRIYESRTLDFGTFTDAIKESCPEGEILINLLDSELSVFSLTTVGIAIGITFYEQLTGLKLDFSDWYGDKFHERFSDATKF